MPRKPSTPNNPLKHLRPTDLRALAQLATQATAGVSSIAEGVHQAVWSTLGFPSGKTAAHSRGITGLVYRSVNGVTRVVGNALDAVLARLQPLFDWVERSPQGSPEREAVLAALNGVLGDTLAASNNPLATGMTLRYRGCALNWQALPAVPQASAKVLLMLHGLCMNDLQWQARSPALQAGLPERLHDHGALLADALGCSAVYLRYNTGRHISQNGLELAQQLELLLAHWPTALQELTVLAHSMGGLLIRSALHQAQHAGMRWPAVLKNIVFLGTPHHGAPLERAGNWVDVLLGSTAYSRPFAKLAQLRSTGITDLRYGLLLDADWQGHEQFRRTPDRREAVPLPAGVACYAVAATTAAKRSLLADRLLGDGLVPLHSALGQHDDASRSLDFAKDRQWIAYRHGHLQLLSSPAVYAQMLQWLRPADDQQQAAHAGKQSAGDAVEP